MQKTQRDRALGELKCSKERSLLLVQSRVMTASEKIAIFIKIITNTIWEVKIAKIVIGLA